MPPPITITHRLRRAQGNARNTLHLLHHVGRVELFARTKPGAAVDFVLVLGSLTATGPTPSAAITAMRAVLRERQAIDGRVLDWQQGLDAGCTPETLSAFCQTNALDPAAAITLGELRRAVTSRRAENQPYAPTLSRLGIHLAPPKNQ